MAVPLANGATVQAAGGLDDEGLDRIGDEERGVVGLAADGVSHAAGYRTSRRSPVTTSTASAAVRARAEAEPHQVHADQRGGAAAASFVGRRHAFRCRWPRRAR